MTPSPVPSLHLLNKSPGHPRFAACLAALATEDTLLLMENAVIALDDDSIHLPAATHALHADCLARGVQGSVPMIDYTDMVSLTERFQRIISW